MGSNQQSSVGCPKTTLQAAIVQLERAGVNVNLVSKFYETPCFPAGSGPDFVNAVVQLAYAGDATSLLHQLHEIEAGFGRERTIRWSQRPLDLDLIAFGESVVPDITTVQGWIDMPLEKQKTCAPDQLLLPHPRIQDRAFVLVPLADIAPDWQHPILGLTTLEMLKVLPNEEVAAVKRIK